MSDLRSAAALEDDLEGLEASFGEASIVLSSFEAELRAMQGSMAVTGASVGSLSSSISRGLRRAFDGLVFDGMKLSEALRTVANSIVNATYSAAMKPVTNHFGGLLASGIQNFIGGVTPFAKGGVVGGPTGFATRGGLGLMGEAGPEAIMPLSRGPDGKLGVRAGGSGSVNITMNISTPDAGSFQRSQGQIAAQMSRALGRGQRNR